MRHGVDEAEADWSFWPSCVGVRGGPVAWGGGVTASVETSPSGPVPSIWWKFHKPTLRIQYEQVRMGRFIACRVGLRKRNSLLRHLHWIGVIKKMCTAFLSVYWLSFDCISFHVACAPLRIHFKLDLCCCMCLLYDNINMCSLENALRYCNVCV